LRRAVIKFLHVHHGFTAFESYKSPNKIDRHITTDLTERYHATLKSNSNHIYWYMATLRLDYTITQSRHTQSHKVL